MKEDSNLPLLANLAKALLKVKAVRIGAFENPEGKVTPYFIDLKSIPSFPDVFSLSIECLERTLREVSSPHSEKISAFDYFCGVQSNGLIFASVLALKSKVPLIYFSEKGRIRGFLSSGKRVLIVDDVSESGKTVQSSVLAVRSAGGVVEDALTLLDREEGASSNLQKIGVKLHSFASTREIGNYLKENLALDEQEEKVMLE